MTVKKLKLDEATKDAMLGLFPVNNDFTVDFTPEEYSEVPKEYQPVFVLKPFSDAQCKAMAKEYEKNPEQEKILEAVRKQIVGLKNLINLSTEEEVQFEAENDGGLSKMLYSFLPLVVKTAILYRLLRISGISR